MSIKSMAGTALVPLLSRIVLGVTFILSGWFFCFQTIELSSADMSRLEQVRTTQTGDAGSPPAAVEGSRVLAVNRLVLHFEGWNLGAWVQPLGWAVAIFQLLAGAALLLGLFTRLASIGFCILIGGAFWQLSIRQNGMFDMNPFTWREHSAAWYTMLSQLPMFILALGLVLTGAGPLCLDRVLFSKSTASSGKSGAKKGTDQE
jgi:uncharacterized membrane protein YphA (DoxX/SURF4 family)